MTTRKTTKRRSAEGRRRRQVFGTHDDLLRTNQQRGQDVGEYELFDALRDEWLANRYFDVEVEYAKASPEDLVQLITVTNRGDRAAPVHVLPQLWYRNTWRWTGGEPPRIEAHSAGVARTQHDALGERWFSVTSSVDEAPALLFCENETNNELLFGSANATATTKDGVLEELTWNTPQRMAQCPFP